MEIATVYVTRTIVEIEHIPLVLKQDNEVVKTHMNKQDDMFKEQAQTNTNIEVMLQVILSRFPPFLETKLLNNGVFLVFLLNVYALLVYFYLLFNEITFLCDTLCLYIFPTFWLMTKGEKNGHGFLYTYFPYESQTSDSGVS